MVLSLSSPYMLTSCRVNPGPMNEYLEPGALGRFLAFWKVFIQATFSYGGSEVSLLQSRIFGSIEVQTLIRAVDVCSCCW